MAGRGSEARQVLRTVERLRQKVYISEYNIAIIESWLGAETEAFEWLKRAWWSRDPWLEHLLVDPRLDSLRPHRKFAELVRDVRLPTLKRGSNVKRIKRSTKSKKRVL
jgi:hypothetical protein